MNFICFDCDHLDRDIRGNYVKNILSPRTGEKYFIQHNRRIKKSSIISTGDHKGCHQIENLLFHLYHFENRVGHQLFTDLFLKANLRCLDLE